MKGISNYGQEPPTKLTASALVVHCTTTLPLPTARESSLNKLAHFHTKEGLIPDVMHNILEGVLPLAIKCILKHLLVLTSFTVVEMNRRIETFDYGVIEASNRRRGNLTTSQLIGGDSLKQSGEYCTLNKHKIGDPCNSNKGIHVIHTTLVQLLIAQQYSTRLYTCNSTVQYN